jgi:hypothetical protein
MTGEGENDSRGRDLWQRERMIGDGENGCRGREW